MEIFNIFVCKIVFVNLEQKLKEKQLRHSTILGDAKNKSKKMDT